MEMRDRLDSPPAGLPAGPPASASAGGGEEAAIVDAVSALAALGYRPVDANRMARAVDDGAKTSEEIIRAALKAVNTP
jgi:Holliday junction DNA helicase RuvA